MTDHDADDLIHMIEQEVREENAPPNLRSADDPEPARKRIRYCVAITQAIEQGAKGHCSSANIMCFCRNVIDAQKNREA